MQVLVVSFGSVEGAQLWLQQTGCTFQMLLDPQRKIYRSFGLGSSYLKVMKFGCLLQYSEFCVYLNKIIQLYIYLCVQLGGDFLLDDTGKVLLSHPSKNPLDRPSLMDVLQALLLFVSVWQFTK
uniref:Selenoprotein L n=1 Tax=Nothobranchius furzeri TaxID=105023 RepID=A0A8C6KI64_NOTFU